MGRMDVKAIHLAARDRYWKDKDLAAARRLLEEGIALARAQGLRGEEKAMSYDLAAFCWYGWDEPGVVITPEDSSAGAQAAEENLRLAIELERPAGPLGNAWWMVGAYRLQEGDYAGAKTAFEAFRTLTEGDRVRTLLAEGYLQIPRLFLEKTYELPHICAELRAAGGDGPEYADQLETAFEVLTRRSIFEGARRATVVIEPVDPVREADALGEVLHACVQGGASVNFVLPFSLGEARDYWRGVEGRIVLAARLEGRIVGTVSLAPAPQPNQPHRADVAKLLVHPDARQRGVARALMLDLERRAREMGRTLLTLDTETDSPAEALYRSLGYVKFGVVPGFALDARDKRAVAASFYYKSL